MEIGKLSLKGWLVDCIAGNTVGYQDKNTRILVFLIRSRVFKIEHENDMAHHHVREGINNRKN